LIQNVKGLRGFLKYKLYFLCQFINNRQEDTMANKVRPIKPMEAAKKKIVAFPYAVFEAFNELLVENFDGRDAVITQKEVVDLMVAKGLDRDEVYKKGWLNVEDVYYKAGWEVEYDRPGWDEDYAAHFTFTAHKPLK